MPRGVPNVLMTRNNRVKRISVSLLPSPETAVQLYHQHGGRLSDPRLFGEDPLSCDITKKQIRCRAFSERYPRFEPICDSVCSGDTHLFQEALMFYIDVSYCLTHS